MVLPFNPAFAIDYSLCNQAVTVYHADLSAGAFTKNVYDRAFLDFKKVQTVDKTGSHEANGFLLVIPTSEPCVSVGDKVFLGIGPEIKTAKEWAEFIPSKVSGLVVVKYVDNKYYNGVMIHVEAGG